MKTHLFAYLPLEKVALLVAADVRRRRKENGLPRKPASPRRRLLFQRAANSIKILCLTISTTLFVNCTTSHHKNAPQPALSVSQKSEGYAILYDLVSDEKNISKLSFIKKERPEFKAVLKKIAATAKETAEGLETFAKKDAQMNLKITHLPTVEQKTRESIAAETQKQILKSSDDVLESKLLMTQVESMNYAAHLAKVLAALETDLSRKQFLQNASLKFAALHDEVYQMLLNRQRR